MRETPKHYRRGMEICNSCEVSEECLEEAMQNPDDCCCLLSGLMAVERERLRRQNRREARAARVEFRQRENGVFELK